MARTPPAHASRSRLFIWIRLASSVLAAFALILAVHAQDARIQFSIAAQPLSSGLLQLGRQANISILAPRELTAGKRGPAVEGELDVRTALTRLLQGSGLTFELVRADFVRIVPEPARKAPSAAPPGADMRESDPGVLEEVTVVARKRPEPLQRVPISVSVLRGDEAAAWNLNNLGDLSSRLPSLLFRPNALHKDRLTFIRGIGTFTTSTSPEPSVSTVIDGVVMSRAGQAAVDLLDIEQVEVLGGPQGTLFGKNASAGVVNIVTKSPTPSLTGYAAASYFEGNEYRLSGAVSGPVAEGVGMRVSGFVAGYDGNMTNLFDGRTVNGYRNQGIRAKAVFDRLAPLTLTFAADFVVAHGDMPPGAYLHTSQIEYCPRYLVNPPQPNACRPGVETPNPVLAAKLASLGIVPSAENTSISNNGRNEASDRNGGAALQADWFTENGYQLTSITAWRTWRNGLRDYDLDGLSGNDPIFPDVIDAGDVDLTQVSQELRVSSSEGGFVDFVAGAYFMHSAADERYTRRVTRYPADGGSPRLDQGTNRFGSSAYNYALFGEINLNFTDRLRALLGYRRVHDRVAFFTDRRSTATASNPVPGVSPDYAAGGHQSLPGWSGRAGLQYDFSPGVTAYATVSHGYKGPAYDVFFNMGAGNSAPIRPETSDAYELGVKGTLWNRRLRFGAAAYLTSLHDYQANLLRFVGGAYVSNFVNAGSVMNRGMELVLDARPLERLTYDAGILYNDAHVRRFPCQREVLVCNVDGMRLPFAPEWRVHAGQDYRHPINEKMDLHLDIEYRWQSSAATLFSDTADLIQPAYGIWDASLSVAGKHSDWTVSLLMRNVLNQSYSSNFARGAAAGVVRWVPRDAERYVGFSVRKEFYGAR